MESVWCGAVQWDDEDSEKRTVESCRRQGPLGLMRKRGF